MKQCIKYCMVAILAVLLYNGATEAAPSLCTTANESTEGFVFQSGTDTRQSIRNFYEHLSTVSLCMEHIDNTQVPGNKSILIRKNLFREYLRAGAPECDRLSYLSSHPVPDPNYYVIGLRKIII